LGGKSATALALALIVAATVTVWHPVTRCAFLNYDDGEYVTDNPQVRRGVDGASVAWAFSHTLQGNYHPLTTLSHMLDVQLWGMSSTGHHATNLVLHLGNALLLFALVRRWTGATWKPTVVALAFSLHPLAVQSVAWIAERKNLLSTLFLLLALHAWTGWVARPRARSYLATTLAFVAGLMAKPMLVTLPLLLLLVDHVAPRRPGPRRFLVEKIPLFVIAGAWSVLTVLTQRAQGAVQSAAAYPLGMRLENAVAAYGWYLGKMFWPVRLAVFYPHPGPTLGAGPVVFGATLLVGVTALVVWRGRRVPLVATGWGWYVVTLLPVIGLVQVGSQAWADRYAYVPLIGCFLALVHGADALAPGPRTRAALATAAAGALLLIAARTSTEIGYWRDSRTLFARAAEVVPDSHLILNNLGMALVEEGRIAEALPEFERAVTLAPDVAASQGNLANALALSGRIAEALPHFEAAMRLDPKNAQSAYNLGQALVLSGRTAQAVAAFEEALRRDPDFTPAAQRIAEIRRGVSRR